MWVVIAEPVTAWRIVAAQTIDVSIAELIDSKAGLAAQALDGSEEEVASSADVQHEVLVASLSETLSAARTRTESCRSQWSTGFQHAANPGPHPLASENARIRRSHNDEVGRFNATA
jgi:hypothetical protein